MAARELSLFADLDQGRLVTGFLSTLQATLPDFVFGDSIPVSFRPLKSTGNNAIYPWSEVDLTGKTVRIAIGVPAGSPLSGTFTLQYAGDETAAIAFDATGAQIATALNALASITAAGGVTVTRATTGAFRVIFNNVGARSGVTAGTAALYPSTGANIRVALEGDGDAKEVVVVRLETLPAAYAELTEDFPVAAATITELREGVPGVVRVIATAASSIMNASASGDGDDFNIGSVHFTFETPADTETKIDPGASDSEKATNIITKINAHSTVLVSAKVGDPVNAIRLTAKSVGAAGNTIATTSATVDFTGATMAGGLDAVTAVTPVSKIVSLEFFPEPYAGSYILTVGDVGSPAIPFDADPSEIASALDLIPAIGVGNSVVTGAFPKFTLELAPPVGAVGAVAIDLASLIVPKGRSGQLTTNSAAMLELLNGSAKANAKLEVELYTIADGTTWTVLQADVTIADDVISNSPSAESGGPAYVTIETLNQRYNPAPILRLRANPASEISPIRASHSDSTFVSRVLLATSADNYEHGIPSGDQYDAKMFWVDAAFGFGHWTFTDKITDLNWESPLVTHGTPPNNLEYLSIDGYPGKLSISEEYIGTGQSLEVMTSAAIPGLWHLYNAAPYWLWHPPGTLWNDTLDQFRRIVISGAIGSETISYSAIP